MATGKEIKDIQYDSEKLTLQFSDGKQKAVPFSQIERITRVFGRSKRSKREGFSKVFGFILELIINAFITPTRGERDLIGMKIDLNQGKSISYRLNEGKDQSLLIKVNKLCHEKGWG